MADLTIDELSIQIKTSVDDATSSINELSKSLKSLQSAVSGVQGTLKKAKSSVSGVQKTVSDLNTTIDKTSKSTSFLDSGLGRIIKTNLLTRLSFRAVYNHVSECLDIATDYTEVLNKLNVAMGDCSEEAISFGEEVQTALGVDMVEWLDYQGTFASMFKGFKVQEDHMAIMSQQLTQLAYDYSSLYNKPVSEAFNKLNSALSGQIKGLKDYGNNVSVAMVQQTALQYGITEQISKLDTATQAYLRYITIMNNAEYTGVFQDMSRTITSTANQMRVLNSMIVQFKRALGEIYNIVATLLLPVFNKLLGVLIIAFRNLKAFLIDFFGLTDYIDFGAGISEAVDVFGETEEAVDNATKSVKKYKKALQGFDELNIIPSQDSGATDSGNVAGAGAGYSFGIDDLPTYDFLGNISSKVMEESQKMYDAIEPVLVLLGKLAIALAIGNIIAKVIGFVSGLVTSFGKMKVALIGVTGNTTALYKGYVALRTALQLLGVPLGAVVGAIALVSGALIYAYQTSEEFREIVGTAIKNVANVLLSVYNGFVKPIINGIIVLVISIWNNGLSFLWKQFAKMVENVASIVLELWNIVSPVLSALFNVIGAILTPAFEVFGSVVGLVIGNVCKKAGTLLATFNTIVGGIKTALTNARNSVKNFCNGILSGMESMINGVIRGINKLISGLNKLSFKVPDFFGGGKVGFNIKQISEVKIPRLYTGGVPSQGQLFYANERGAELVSHIGGQSVVANNQDMLDLARDTMVDTFLKLAMKGNSTQPIHITVYTQLDKKTIAKSTVEYVNGQIKQTGVSPIKG